MDTPIKIELPDYYLTKHGRKCFSSGLPIFYIGFKKKLRVNISEWVYNFYPLARLSKEEELPENILEIGEKVNFFELAKKLPKGIIWKKEDEVIKILDIYSKEESILIDTLIAKGIFRQRFFTAVKSYHQKGFIISIRDSEKPDITDEVHRAIVVITLEIQKIFKNSRILKSTCKKKILEELQNL